jgi:biotin carboxylase
VTRVLLLATTTGYQIRSFGEAAERLGVRLVFASDRCDRLDDPWWDDAIAVRFHDTEASVAAVTSAWSGPPPDGIVAVGDRPTVLAAHLAAAFGIPGNPPAAAERSRNKLAARGAFQQSHLPTPGYRAVPLDCDVATLAREVTYPAVVKPLALSGSRGVMRVNDAGECVRAFERLRGLLHAPDVLLERDAAHGQALIESFIPGREFAIEGLLLDGALRPLAIFDKPDPLDGPFFEETIYVTPSREPADVQQRILRAVRDAAQALGLRHGPVHAECRVDQDRVYVLEVAARPIGGLCSKALRFAGPRGLASLEEVLLRHALGEPIDEYRREPPASGVMMIPIPRRGVYRDVEGLEEARAVPDVHDVRITAKAGTTIVPLPEGRSYLGFIFARAPEADAVERALRDAHARLRFHIDREIPVT